MPHSIQDDGYMSPAVAAMLQQRAAREACIPNDSVREAHIAEQEILEHIRCEAPRGRRERSGLINLALRAGLNADTVRFWFLKKRHPRLGDVLAVLAVQGYTLRVERCEQREE